MREQKFRAWDKKQEKWLGVNLHMSVIDGLLWWQFGYGCEILSSDERKNVELVEYTGLKDKNDNEIYEGDIVKVSPPFTDGDTQIVHWSKSIFGFAFGGYALPQITFDKVFEVIGNIHDNPELVEATK